MPGRVCWDLQSSVIDPAEDERYIMPGFKVFRIGGALPHAGSPGEHLGTPCAKLCLG